MPGFPDALKDWRARRRLSQLQLAAEAGVSPRHLAFLETGRARPSRAMVLRLAEALDLPLAARNAALAAAGFAAHYADLPLEAGEMAEVRAAMDWTIRRHAPWPGLVMDGDWRLVALNGPAARLMAAAGLGVGDSLLDLAGDLARLRALVGNWQEVGHLTALRLRAESQRAGGHPALERAAAALLADPGIAAHRPRGGAVVVPTVWRAGGMEMSFISTYATFGAAEEVSASGLKIELMFPADAATRAALLALEAASGGKDAACGHCGGAGTP